MEEEERNRSYRREAAHTAAAEGARARRAGPGRRPAPKRHPNRAPKGGQNGARKSSGMEPFWELPDAQKCFVFSAKVIMERKL